ncbi:MAG: alkyl sulfatase dimerization domain-containing protein, partial [Chloroflexota bacterium]|nr:alkyl sulfatase dimerization domain-containing protein [Chloroflexota bacterium]
MNKLMIYGLSLFLAFTVFTGNLIAAPVSQYNMSLQDKVITGPKGSLTSPQAASANKLLQIEEKSVQKIADGIYRIGGWGIGNLIAVEGPKGWIIVDAGDYLEVAEEQRRALEDKVGKITVAAVLYTHSHYAFGAKAWQDKNTKFYGHEDLVANLNADQGVSVLSGNFNARASIQFGILHPAEGPDAFPSYLGFGTEKLTGTKAFVPPDVTFKDGVVETHDIAGLRVEVLPSKTDVADSVAFYFPDKKLLVSNALAAGMIFNLYTLRGDWYRDPMIFVEAADLALSRDIEYHVDIHGAPVIGKEKVIAGIQETRDQMQLIHDQTYRAISLGLDAQGAAEMIYLPEAVRKDKELYGQVESHVKRVYSARIGWMGWDVYDINPLSKARFSSQLVDAMGGADKVLKQAKVSNAKKTLEGWQWSLYLTSQLLQLDNDNPEAKTVRAEAARALGQRTTSANARGFYISEALLHEGKMRFGEHAISHYQQLSKALGAVTAKKLAASPLNDNVQYLRFMIDPRLAEGKRAEFNVNFTDEKVSYAIALRN